MTNYYNASFRNLIYRLRRFKEIDRKIVLERAIETYKPEIESLFKEHLYYTGEDGYGRKLEPYKDRTIYYKRRRGQPTNRTTLKDTGKFYASIEIIAMEDGFLIVSDNPVAKFLVSKYGNAILRISNATLSIIMEDYIKPLCLSQVRKIFLQKGIWYD